MNDSHPLMALLLEHNSFLGHVEHVEDDIQPLDDQLNFGPGDAAILAGSNIPLEHDFVIVRGLDPQQHAETFPDWEERMLGTGLGWNSHVLCELFSRADPEPSIGWVSRLKLMPIPKYRYKEARRWMKNGFPDQMPDWCDVVYHKYTAALAERAPEIVPVQVECPNCHQRTIELVVYRRIEYRAKAGQIRNQGKIQYVPIHPPEEGGSHTARLVCTNCEITGDLDDEEWVIPDVTN